MSPRTKRPPCPGKRFPDIDNTGTFAIFPLKAYRISPHSRCEIGLIIWHDKAAESRLIFAVAILYAW